MLRIRDSSAKRSSALIGVWALASGAAILIGLLSAYKAWMAGVLIVAALVLVTAFLWPHWMLYILVAVVFGGTLKVAGVTVGRLTAPLALLAIAAEVTRNPSRRVMSTRTPILVAGYTLLAFASLIWTVDIAGSIDALASLSISLIYMLAFAVLLKSPSNLKVLLRVIIICSTILGLWWISSYLRGIDRGSNPAGDPNFFAALQLITLPLVLVFISSAKKAGRSTWLLYLVALIILSSIVSTLSRGGLVATSAALMFIALTPKTRLFTSRSDKVGSLLATFAALVLSLALVWPTLATRIQNEDKYGAGGRVDLQRAAISAYRINPYVGVGFGGFKALSSELLRTTPGVSRLTPFKIQLSGLYAHNTYLGTLAELGPLGLLLFLGLLVSTTISLLLTARRAEDIGETFVASVSNAFAVGLLSYSVAIFFVPGETSRALWLIMGISIALSNLVGSQRAGGCLQRRGRARFSGSS